MLTTFEDTSPVPFIIDGRASNVVIIRPIYEAVKHAMTARNYAAVRFLIRTYRDEVVIQSRAGL